MVRTSQRMKNSGTKPKLLPRENVNQTRGRSGRTLLGG